MQVSEIRTRVQRQFGDESGALIDASDILRWMNDAQVDIIRQTDALDSVQTTAVTVGTVSVTLPTTYLYVKGVTLNSVPLSLVSFQDGFSADATYPQYARAGMCYVNQSKLWINPLQASGNLVVYYNRRPVALANDTDVPEIPVQMHEDIVRYCISRAKELNEDLDGAAVIMQDYNRRMLSARAEVFTPDNASYGGIRVLPGDGGDF